MTVVNSPGNEQASYSSRRTRSRSGTAKSTKTFELLGVKRKSNIADSNVASKRSRKVFSINDSDMLLDTSSKQCRNSSTFNPTVVLEKLNVAKYLSHQTLRVCQSVKDGDKCSNNCDGASLNSGNLCNDANEQTSLTSKPSSTNRTLLGKYDRYEQNSPLNASQKKHSRRNLHCPRCKQRSFAQQRELDTHLACHNDSDDAYHCPVCEYHHNSWSRILAHLLIHPNMYERLRDAEIVRNIVGKFACQECGRIFDKKQSMKYHMAKVHSLVDKKCESCGITFANTTEKAFCTHYDSCAGLEHRCEQCSFTTRSMFNYHKHVTLHGEQAAKCEVCGAMFPTAQRLKQHSVVHSDDRPLRICEHCGKAFKTNDAVEKHVVRFHSDNDRPWPCSQCSYRAKLKVDLKKHSSLVHDKKFKCAQCPYSTNICKQLDDHMTCHTVDSSLPCDWSECYFRAATAVELENHRSTVHNATSKHLCPVCQKRFRKRTNLVRHLLTHTGGRPYSCGDCSATFASHSTYYRHRQRTGHDLRRQGGAALPHSIVVHVMTGLDCTNNEMGSLEHEVVDGLNNSGEVVDSQELIEHTLDHSGENESMLEHCEVTDGLDNSDGIVTSVNLHRSDGIVVDLT